MDDWKLDWHAFVMKVARDARSGKSGIDLSRPYEANSVEWVGRVAQVKLKEEYARGVRMTMPLVIVPLGRRGLVGEHLWLNVDDIDIGAWEKVAVGDVVRFSGWVQPNDGTFCPVGIIKDDEQDRDFLTIGVSRGRYQEHA